MSFVIRPYTPADYDWVFQCEVGLQEHERKQPGTPPSKLLWVPFGFFAAFCVGAGTFKVTQFIGLPDTLAVIAVVLAFVATLMNAYPGVPGDHYS